MDELPHQLIEDINTTDIEPGKGERVDYEYIRHGVANIFMANEPLRGRRIVETDFTFIKICFSNNNVFFLRFLLLHFFQHIYLQRNNRQFAKLSRHKDITFFRKMQK